MKEIRLAYPEDLIQAVGAYLMTRPYQEVVHLIQGLQIQAVKTEHCVHDEEQTSETR